MDVDNFLVACASIGIRAATQAGPDGSAEVIRLIRREQKNSLTLPCG